MARYELVGLIFLRIIVKMWRRSLNYSVTVDVFNSSVLLLGGPCMELQILSSLTWNIYTFFSKLSRHFVKSVLKHLKNLCFCVKDPQNHLYLATDPPIWKYVVPVTLQKQNIWVKNVHCDRIFKDLRHIFTILQKYQTYKLISRHSVARYELVDLIFFNS